MSDLTNPGGASAELEALERAQAAVIEELRSIIETAEALVVKATSLGVKIPLELRTLKLGSKPRKPRTVKQPEAQRVAA